ncbi:hypothetical protein AGMMS49938_13870 [Fibrobacterales bacterium]|nr:hypothetical protein AGMMS49938_13870 [Fibrobacterales bacterium]
MNWQTIKNLNKYYTAFFLSHFLLCGLIIIIAYLCGLQGGACVALLLLALIVSAVFSYAAVRFFMSPAWDKFTKIEKSRSRFVANVSHELKTPITSIKGFIETLMQTEIGKDAESAKYLDIVLRQSDRLNAIVNDLLMLSRIEENEKQPEFKFEYIPVYDLFRSVIQQVEAINEKHIKFEIEILPSMLVYGNAGLLEQCFLNLATNAYRYSDPEKTVYFRGDRQGNTVRLSVEDEGYGIEEKYLPRIFERFYRIDKARSRKLGGTGLGLAIVKHIVLLHRGKIDVTSMVGHGSKFFVFLKGR